MTFCSAVSEAEWSAAFRRKVADQRVPVSGFLELTSRCNLKCLHCYLGPQEEQHKKRAQEMSTERVFEVIDQICAEGCLYLVISGGDPMVRRDFPEIYKYAREKGLIVTVFCDGILVTDSIVELFQEYPPFKVDISIYGATTETYESITRVPGSFAKFLKGVKRLADGGISFCLKTVLMTLNKHEVQAMHALADKLGSTSFRVDSAIFPCLPDNNREPLDLRVEAEEAVALELSDNDALVQWIDYSERYSDMKTDNRLYTCGAGVTNFYIDPYGNASPCLMTTNHSFAMTASRGFGDLWSKELMQIQKIEAGADYACNSCEMKTACTGCPAFNFQETGHEDQAPEYLCETTRHRWAAIQRAQAEQAQKTQLHEPNRSPSAG